MRIPRISLLLCVGILLMLTAAVTRVETTADGSELVLSNGMHTPSSAVRAILSA